MHVPVPHSFIEYCGMDPLPGVAPGCPHGRGVVSVEIVNDPVDRTEPPIKWRFYNPYAAIGAIAQRRSGDDQIATLVDVMRVAKASRPALRPAIPSADGNAGRFYLNELWVVSALCASAYPCTAGLDVLAVLADRRKDDAILDALLGDVIDELKQQR